MSNPESSKPSIEELISARRERFLETGGRHSKPAENLKGFRVEDDMGGPTSLYEGPITGLARIVAIAHNRKVGLPLDHGLEQLANPDDIA
jgi:hypothetical protein